MRPNDADELARILKVLAAGVRVRIVQLLKGRTLCVNALASRLDVTQGAVSQHLRIMRDAALVIDEKRGHFVHYRLNEATLARWRQEIDALLAPATGGACDCGGKVGRRASAKRPDRRSGKEGTHVRR